MHPSLRLPLAALGALAAPVALGQESRAPEEPSAVALMRVEGALDAGTQSHLRRAVEAARTLAGTGTPRLVIELDTPGGEVELMWTLANQIDQASEEGVQVAAWIHHRAYSAGALVAMACDELYVTQQGAMGAAAPVQMGPGGMQGVVDDTARAKITSALRGSFRGWAERHGRSTVLAEAMIDTEVGVKQVLVDGETIVMSQREYDDLRERGQQLQLVRTIVPVGELLTLAGSEAVELGMADGLADSVAVVIDKMGVPGARVQQVERTKSDDLAATLNSIKYILLVLAMLGAFAEIKTPGFGVPGIGAIVCLALFLFGRYLVGLADMLHILAVAAGVILIAVEIFVMPGTIWVGLLGALLAIGGLIASTVFPSGALAMPLDRSMAIGEAFRMMLGLFVAALGAWVLSRVMPHTPVVSRLVLSPGEQSLSGSAVTETASVDDKREHLMGAVGEALTDLRPVGKVRLEYGHEGDLEARAEGGALDCGARVRVVAVTSGRIVVAAAEEREST